MALNYGQLKVEATHAVNVDSSTIAPGSTQAAAIKQIVNEAGRLLYSSHTWRFRTTTSSDLDFTEDQAYIDLPNSFGEFVGIARNSLTSHFQWSNLQTIVNLRARDIAPVGFQWWGALSWPRLGAAPSNPLKPRIELYPTPTADLTGALTIYYKAHWTELSADEDFPDIPIYCETLLRLFIRAIAEGYQNAHGEEGGILPTVSADDRIQRIMEGPIWKMAVREDGQVQVEEGVVGNGLIGNYIDTSGVGSFARPQDVWPVGDPFVT